MDLPDPVPGRRDLLVEVRAVSANPVDTKQRKRAQPAEGQWAILGYDCVGVVRDVGSLNGTYVNRQRIDEAQLEPGDEVQIGKFRLVYYRGRQPQ